MGLDMYAYAAAHAGHAHEFREGATWDDITKDLVNPHMQKPREIAYWRKHHTLHNWMHELYQSRGGTAMFNGIELELTWNDLDALEQAIKNRLPEPDSNDQRYYQQDLEFVKMAKADVFMGLKVFYDSSW